MSQTTVSDRASNLGRALCDHSPSELQLEPKKNSNLNRSQPIAYSAVIKHTSMSNNELGGKVLYLEVGKVKNQKIQALESRFRISRFGNLRFVKP